MADMVFLTKLKPEPMGVYSISTDYGVNSLVTNGARAYLSVKDVPAGTPLTNTEYWKIHTDLSAVKQSTEDAANEALAAVGEARNLKKDLMDVIRNLTDTVEAEGNPVQADLVGGIPFDKVNTILEPIQAGSGDPHPAGFGKNIIDLSKMRSSTSDTIVERNDNIIRVYSTAAGTYRRGYIPDLTLKAGVNYTISAEVTAIPGGYARVGFVDQATSVSIANSIITFDSIGKKTLTFNVAEDTTAYFGAWCSWSTAIIGDATFKNIQVEIGSNATEYAPYENIRPISGWTDAKLARTGKNLLPNTATTQIKNGVTFTINTDGSVTADGTATATTQIWLVRDFVLKAGTSYKLTGCPAGGSANTYMMRLNDGATIYASDIGNGSSYTPSKDVTLGVDIRIASGATVNNLVFYPMICLATETDASYEPYSGNTYTAEFGQTVYGGTLDWQAGMLTAEWTGRIIDGTENINSSTANDNTFRIAITKESGTANPVAICSHFKKAYNTVDEAHFYLSASQIILFIPNELLNSNDLEGAREYLAAQYSAGTPVQVCWKLDSPIIIQLTPQDIAQLDGVNILRGDGLISITGSSDPSSKNACQITVDRNLFSINNAIEGGYASSTSGEILSNETMLYTDYIPVMPNEVLYATNQYMQIAWYDMQKKYVSGIYFNNIQIAALDGPYQSISVPNAAYYMRVSIRTGDKRSFIISRVPPVNTVLPELARHNVVTSQIVSDLSNCMFDEKLNENFVPSNILVNQFKFNGVDGYTVSGNGTLMYYRYTTMDESEIISTFNASTAFKARFGYDPHYYYNTSESGFAVEIDSASKKIKAYRWNWEDDAMSEITNSETAFAFDVADGSDYCIRILKDSVNHVKVELFNALCPGDIATIEIHGAVSTSNENVYVNQCRCWGGFRFTNYSGTVTVKRIAMYSRAPKNPKVAIWGDSFVENYGRNPLCSYAHRLRDELDGNVFLSGRGGAATDDLLARMPTEINLCHPQFTIIQIGANDSSSVSTEVFKSNLLTLIGWIESNNSIPVLVTVPRRMDNDNVNWISEINPWIRSLGYRYIDVAYALSTGDGLTANNNKYMTDKVHPNINGGAAILQAMRASIPELF